MKRKTAAQRVADTAAAILSAAYTAHLNKITYKEAAMLLRAAMKRLERENENIVIGGPIQTYTFSAKVHKSRRTRT